MEQNVSIEEVLNNSFATIYDVLKLVDSNINDIVINNLNNNAESDEILRLKQFKEDYIRVIQETKILQGSILGLFGYINKDINDIKEEELRLQQEMMSTVQLNNVYGEPQNVVDMPVEQEIDNPTNIYETNEVNGNDEYTSSEMTDEVSAEEIAGNEMADEVSAEAIAGNEMADEVSAEEIAGNEMADEVSAEAIAGTEVTDEVSAEAIAGAEATDEVSAEAIAGTEVTDEVSAEAIAGTEMTDEVSAEAIAGTEATDEVSAEAIAGTEATDEVSAEAIAGAEATDEVSAEPSVEIPNITFNAANNSNEADPNAQLVNSTDEVPNQDALINENSGAEVALPNINVPIVDSSPAVETSVENATVDAPVEAQAENSEVVLPTAPIPETQTEEPQVVLPSVNLAETPSEAVETTTEVNDNSNILVFNKNTNDAPRAILVTNDQCVKLMLSKEAKKALLNAKGLFINDSNLEQQLVQNGLLEGSVEDKQKLVQSLLAEAQELYKSGNTVEAQEKMNQVAQLNEEIKNVTQQQVLQVAA